MGRLHEVRNEQWIQLQGVVMNYVVYSKSTSVTGKELAKQLGFQGVITNKVISPEVVIRWGSVRKTGFKKEFNSVESASLARDKPGMLRLLNKAGIGSPHVILFGDKDRDEQIMSMKLPFISRNNVHMGGSGFRWIHTKSEAENEIKQADGSRHWAELIKSDNEYRVHVFQGRIIRVAIKSKPDDGSVACEVVKSHHNGWIFCGVLVKNAPKRVKQAAVMACDLIKIDFAAVDVITSGDKAYVLELNTAPGLTGITLERYVKAFKDATQSTSA
jgi:glutathione synthase/RimK-type ligase-like ATP-grasp enzyme